MIQRDYLLRQIQQAANVLAQVLFHKKEQEYEHAQEVLTAGLETFLGLPAEDLRHIGRNELLSLCELDGTFSSDKAIALADLLREDARDAGRERALWLYEAVEVSGQTVPIDINDRIRALRVSLRS